MTHSAMQHIGPYGTLDHVAHWTMWHIGPCVVGLSAKKVTMHHILLHATLNCVVHWMTQLIGPCFILSDASNRHKCKKVTVDVWMVE